MNSNNLSVRALSEELNALLVAEPMTHDLLCQIDALLNTSQQLIVIEPTFCLSNPVLAHLILQRCQAHTADIKKITFVTGQQSGDLESHYYQQFMERYQFLPVIELLELSEFAWQDCCLITDNQAVKVTANIGSEPSKSLVLDPCDEQELRWLHQSVQQVIGDHHSQIVAFETQYIN